MSLALKQEGEKLTGKLSSPGRDGGAAPETDITDASVKGADVAFWVTQEFNERKMTFKYSGKLRADAITGKVESKDRDGNDRSRDYRKERGEVAGSKARPGPGSSPSRLIPSEAAREILQSHELNFTRRCR